MPDKRRPGAALRHRATALPMPLIVHPSDVLNCMAKARLPIELDQITASLGAARGHVHRTLKAMQLAGQVRWIPRHLGGPGYALPKPQ